MYLKIRHATSYTYSETQRMVVQSHRLYPSQCPSQTVIEWQVSAEGAQFSDYFVDGAGDRLRTMTLNKEVNAVEIMVEGIVQTVDTDGVERIKIDRIPPQAYCVESPLTKANQELVSLANDSILQAGNNQLDQAHAMMTAIGDTIVYTPDSTTSAHTAAQVLKQAQGVCQDQTHCLLSIARVNGIPARYITGYLYDPEKGDNYGESHAWAELFIKDLGWVGFDATNRCSPNERYVRIGSGLDSVDAALIRGISRGIGSESMQTSVQVSQAQQ